MNRFSWSLATLIVLLGCATAIMAATQPQASRFAFPPRLSLYVPSTLPIISFHHPSSSLTRVFQFNHLCVLWMGRFSHSGIRSHFGASAAIKAARASYSNSVNYARNSKYVPIVLFSRSPYAHYTIQGRVKLPSRPRFCVDRSIGVPWPLSTSLSGDRHPNVCTKRISNFHTAILSRLPTH